MFLTPTVYFIEKHGLIKSSKSSFQLPLFQVSLVCAILLPQYSKWLCLLLYATQPDYIAILKNVLFSFANVT